MTYFFGRTTKTNKHKMNKHYKFKGKGLFYFAAIFCIVTIILSPVGILFIYMASKAKVIMTDTEFTYAMLRTYKIPYGQIQEIKLSKPVGSAYHLGGGAFVNFATVVPLIIDFNNGKSIRFSSNFFENAVEIVEILEEKTGLKLKEA